MRHNRTSRRFNDRGAAAVIVGASLVALLGATSLAVDLGNHRATSSRATTAAEGASLAAAQSLTAGGTETAACAAAATRVQANEAGATMDSCAVGVTASGSTIVTVEVSKPVDYVFAEVLGFSEGTAAVTSSARWGPIGVQGARPFGICMESLGSLLGSWDPLGTTSIGPVTVPYGKGAQPAACNGGNAVPGNWGSLDFNGGSNGTPDQIDWIENGYDGTIFPDAPIDGDTGAISNALAGALDALILSGEVFPVPLFGSVGGGSGSNATFNIIGFVSAQLTGYNVTGSAATRSITLNFYPGEWPGVPCCDISGSPVHLAQYGVCATDEDTDAC